MSVTEQPQTGLEEIRITKDSDADLYQELMGVLPDLMDKRDELSEARKFHISSLKAEVDELTKTFKEIVLRAGWGANDEADTIRVETYQIVAKLSGGHEVGRSTRMSAKRVA